NSERIDGNALGRITVKSSSTEALLTTEGPLPPHLHEKFCKPFLTEELLSLTFRVSPLSFFQVNPPQAATLYSRLLEKLSLKGKEVVDAYCGVGALTLCAAIHAGHITGIEGIPSAIEDAVHNAQHNQISNATFLCDS